MTWPGAVYSLEVGIAGTDGVLTIDDTHRDMVLAVSKPQGEGYAPDQTRLVDFLGSYPPGDMALGELRGPMADETVSWLNRVALGLPTPAATVEEAHKNLMLTKALDLSAKRKSRCSCRWRLKLKAPKARWRARVLTILRGSCARQEFFSRNSPAILSSCATSGAASGTPSRSRSSRHGGAARPACGFRPRPEGACDSFSSQYAGRPRPCSRKRQEARDIERDDEVPGVGLARIVGIEIDHVAAERRAIERPGDQPEHHGEAAALVAADRQQQAFGGAPGIGDVLAGLGVHHPARLHRFSLQRVVLHRAVGDDRGRHVEHQRPGARRHAERQRVGAEQLSAPPHTAMWLAFATAE